MIWKMLHCTGFLEKNRKNYGNNKELIYAQIYNKIFERQVIYKQSIYIYGYNIKVTRRVKYMGTNSSRHARITFANRWRLIIVTKDFCNVNFNTLRALSSKSYLTINVSNTIVRNNRFIILSFIY